AAEYRERVKDHPNDADAHYSLALALIYNEHWAEAAVHLRRVTELNADFVDAYSRLAICLANLGELAEAAEAVEAGLAVAPADPKLLELQDQIARLRSGRR
ncbi:MAG: tetratricopeptide repeat protein, partial [Armatimonadetes bacterium]|nr:tetratricopeptide repeat protein [Armatimonadota bacterium]